MFYWGLFNCSSPEEKIKALEKKVNELIEESCFANSRGEYQLVYFYINPTLHILVSKLLLKCLYHNIITPGLLHSSTIWLKY